MIQKINHLASVVMVKLNASSMNDYVSLKQASNIIHISFKVSNISSHLLFCYKLTDKKKKLVQINHICKHNLTVSKYNMIMTWYQGLTKMPSKFYNNSYKSDKQI
jgi:hypothetical protein